MINQEKDKGVLTRPSQIRRNSNIVVGSDLRLFPSEGLLIRKRLEFVTVSLANSDLCLETKLLYRSLIITYW
jgi:hypothetical protein